MSADPEPLRLRTLIRDIPDYPEPGVLFRDITPLLADAGALAQVTDSLSAPLVGAGVQKVVGIEARGFILGAAVALRLGAGFVPVRKAGKLPSAVHTEDYVLEYGAARLEIHADALAPGERVLIVDDVIATGGTAAATARLVERLGAVPVALHFVIELGFLAGRAKLERYDVRSLMVFDEE